MKTHHQNHTTSQAIKPDNQHKARATAQPESNKLLSAKELLVVLFSKGSRPSERWLREMQVQRKIPYIKIGHLVRFDPVEVRAALVANWTVEPRTLRRR